MANFNKMYKSIIEQMSTPPQQPNNQQPQSNTSSQPLDTKSLADQISKLDPNKLDPKHQELLTNLQALLTQAKTTQPAPVNNANAVNQPNQNGQKPM